MKHSGILEWRKGTSWFPFLFIVLKYAALLVLSVYLIQLMALYLLLHPEKTYPVFGILIVVSGAAGAMILQVGRRTTDTETKSRLNELSERERKVCMLMLEAYTNKQICEQLFIEHSTLKTHINKIYKKLGVSNRKSLRERFGS